ncbi:PREDICTED: uncharacterized protein LOC104607409 isoform X2 [Nelumbo nucifera]|uniref:Uncharacterized protein LOC104607409 isoform X2 n=1 Tax=Nelumbo nucifera TaxID=4432 RepID=A0A1U8ATY0_NELNU|nr:PREDICTED: uncharacterized protein LOC104607409 isoform X2 [Nelumbo nucifera]
MFLRRVTGNLLRMFRFPSKTIVTTCERTITISSTIPLSSKVRFSSQYSSGISNWWQDNRDVALWIILSGQAAIVLGMNGNRALAEDSADSGTGNDIGDANLTALRKIEDGSVVSNSHTSKWRIFTDNGRDLFLQGKLEEAEKYFLSALEEAKQGFGVRDPHVASACNNLAELYRVKRAFDKAEPLYLEAVNILEESFGPEDIRVGAAFHNLGQFYLVQRKLEEARVFYVRALKIKGRVLGYAHRDYADTMYHLGTVLYLLGKEKDAEALVQDSVRILEEAGQGESVICLRRLRKLAQMLIKSNQLTEAENVQRKILHVMELSKGWNSLDTIIAAESLALTLQSVGSLIEAQELLERCLDARKSVLPENHIQIGANMLHMARIAMLYSNQLRKVDISKASAELDKAKVLLNNSIRIANQALDNLKQKGSNMQNNGDPRKIGKDEHAAMVILLQSFDALGLLEITKQKLQEPKEKHGSIIEAEKALQQCLSTFKEPRIQMSISNSPEVKSEYLSCLKHLLGLISESTGDGIQQSRKTVLKELKDEINRVETELSSKRKHRK